MKGKREFYKRLFLLIALMLSGFTLFMPPSDLFAAMMGDYCLIPPYVKKDIEPNVLIMMDNSESMKNAAYNTSTADDKLSSDPDYPSYEVLDSYNSSKTYAGYFVSTQWYSYVGNEFEPDCPSTVAGCPAAGAGGCDPSVDPDCDPHSDNLKGAFYGNLLNWAITSKFDLLETILVGGKSVNPFSSPNTLKGESNKWLGDAGSCRFVVNGGNLTITETTANACSLLNSPPTHPATISLLAALQGIPVAQKTGYGSITLALQGDVQSSNAVSKEEIESKENSFMQNIFSKFVKSAKALGKFLMGFIVSDAYAAAPLRVSTNSISNGTACQYYNVTVSATGGTSPYTWSASNLPDGLQMCQGPANCADGTYSHTPGTIYGTPTTAQSKNVTVTVTDAVSATDSKTYNNVTIGAASALNITTNILPSWPQNLAGYSAVLTAGGGCTPYTWSISAGSLPTGLSLCSGTANCGSYVGGTIYGTPTTVGTSNFTVMATDLSSSTDTQPLSITITAATTLRSQNFNNWVCVGTYTNNCNVGTPSKSGIVDMFIDKARFGLLQFKTSGGTSFPDIGSGTCVSPDQSSNFTTAIQNIGIESGVMPLVNGLSYRTLSTEDLTGAITYYMNNVNSSCNPFRDANACLKNFILMITAGEGANTGTNVLSANDTGSCSTSASYALSKNACYGYSNDLRNSPTIGAETNAVRVGKQYTNTYIVNTMGSYTCTVGASTVPCKTILSEAATKGGGTFYDVTDPTTLKDKLIEAFQDIIKRAAAGTAASVLASGEGSGANLIQAVFYPRRKFFNTATGVYDEIAWIGRLTNLWYYVDPFFSTSTIRADGGDKILDLDTDGTAPAGSDYIVQLYYDSANEATKARRWYDKDGDGIVFPTDTDDTQLSDVEFENLGNLWEAGLELWKRDITVAATKRKIYTTLDSKNLLSGNFSQDTNDNGSNTDNVDADKAATLRTYLDLPSIDNDGDGLIDGDIDRDGDIDDTDAKVLIRYIHGEDVYSWLRSRTVKVETYDTTARVWKLGDILNSTPKISSWLPLNSYQKVYKDTTYGEEGKDPSLSDAASSSHYITSSAYKSRNMVYAGANDGMLHAFKLGTLGLKWNGQGTYQKATLGKHCSNPSFRPCVTGGVTGGCTALGDTCDTDTDLGKEMWAFIPKNVLPYLKYTADTGYCHAFSVDLTPYIFDASINIDESAASQYSGCTNAANSDIDFDYWKCKKSANSWKTILIGGMRFGGACKYSGDTCTNEYMDSVAGLTNADCVKSPAADNGLSSYFALDITDQNKPKLLWEFSHAGLGYTTTGPALVRINARKDDGSGTKSIPDIAGDGTNGRWFVVFASGPTGPIDTTKQQFLGRSDQNLKLFIIDLKKGPTKTATNDLVKVIDTAIPNAFAGSVLNASHDVDQDYQDDILYIPYVKAEDATLDTTTRWTEGGVLRLITNEDRDGIDVTSGNAAACDADDTALNPNCWVSSKLIDDTGPVTAATVRLQNKNSNTLWVYFGAGRYYYEKGNETDDPDTQRQIFGVVEPCFSGGTTFHAKCTNTVTTDDSDAEVLRTVGGLSTVDLSSAAGVTTTTGWKISLDATGVPSGYKAERVITDPLATSTGVVFFTTYKPYSDECSLGGKSFIWAVKYDTGGAAGTLLKGKALIQVSTGSIEQMDMSTAFGEKGDRRTSAMEGVPPTAQGLSIVSTPPALKRVLHIRQR